MSFLRAVGTWKYTREIQCKHPFIRQLSAAVHYRRLSTSTRTRVNSCPPLRDTRFTPRLFSRPIQVEKVEDSVALKVHGEPLSFGSFWLRDNCQCSNCIHPDTRQRIGDTFSIPTDVSPEIKEYVHDEVKIRWSDGHQSTYSMEWLDLHRARLGKDEKTPLSLRPFQSHTPGNESYPTVEFGQVMKHNEALLEWLENIHKWGFCFVDNVPVGPDATQSLLERISFIRHTHYGGFWDFTADLTYKDTAYTTDFLGAHTDNTYFTDPARLQLFHLLSHTDGHGGESLLVDGFKAAQVMMEENPEHCVVLAEHSQPTHSSGNEDVCIQPNTEFPVFNTTKSGHLYQIRWNNYDRAAKTNWSVADQKAWYAAAGHWSEVIRRPDMEIWTQLKPGSALIFDNWRMLHGRSDFIGKRRMCGGYINNDDFLSRYRLLKFGRNQVLNHIGSSTAKENSPNMFF
ncbi:hypothetical protein ASPZODRAFT_1716192 [Penicilliopsis zonata CBS 506.65]|uniref:Trimethyllysine dioxygenase n=1 Tax=Penicilliopsis zonata CBS 506.65 TaxID=1073090 RepID=A0A1L9SKE7_9EURO|nr:hypothetical protein ASPZODRAFT_1716192 [Penicilliopsis zonata CBS 506.65]OJJ47566.1 hypothetical protein ASPZODRAFT_1716192 [Penicilliopsis zonata CBS 506.65]